MSVNLGMHSPRMKVAKRTEKLGTHISALFFLTALRMAAATSSGSYHLVMNGTREPWNMPVFT